MSGKRDREEKIISLYTTAIAMEELYAIFSKYPSVSTNSRSVTRNSIFFALRGDSFDGNIFAADALERGAKFAVVDNPAVAVSDRYIVVESVLATLQQLAAYHRQVLGIPILAITGSNGKTTSKELLSRVLACRYTISATKGNLNNHVGVPLTLLEMSSKTEFGVVEMGASACGEIELLCSIAQPDFGVITNIGRSHLEGFGSLEGVQNGKGELFAYLAQHGGLAFYLEEDPLLVELVNRHLNMATEGYTLKSADGIKSHLMGEYNRYNIALAVAVGDYFDTPREQTTQAINSYIPDNMRSQRVSAERNSLILDCYNANPSSMNAALDDFVEERTTHPKVAVLGDMLELGSYTKSEHEAIVERISKEGELASVYFVGASFMGVTKVSKVNNTLSFIDTAALRNYLIDNPIEGSLILLKGSRSIGLDQLVDML